jgi:hypothetical protein
MAVVRQLLGGDVASPKIRDLEYIGEGLLCLLRRKHEDIRRFQVLMDTIPVVGQQNVQDSI